MLQDSTVWLNLYLEEDYLKEKLLGENDRKETPLFFAKTPAMVDCLLKYGFSPNDSNRNFESAFHRACRTSDPCCVEKLCEVGVEPNNFCGFGWTALHRAAMRKGLSDKLEIMALLLKHGADWSATVMELVL